MKKENCSLKSASSRNKNMSEKKEKSPIDIDISELFKSQKEEIKKMALESLKERITENIRWTMGEKIGEAVKDFVAKEIAPEVQKTLIANKQEFLNQIVVLAKDLGNEVAKALLIKAQKNLTNSWDVEKIGEALFK